MSFIMRPLTMIATVIMLSFLSSSAHARPTLRLCTGGPQGHYVRVGQLISRAVAKDIDVKVIETRGSWENLGRIHGDEPQCDAMIAQDDAIAVYLYEHPEKIGEIERVVSLYPEHLQVICNRAVEVSLLSELDPDTRMLVGPYGTGTYITWTLIKRLVPERYGVFRELELGGRKGVAQMLKTGRPQCLLLVQALAQGLMAQINDELGEQLHLLTIDDHAFQFPINQGGAPRELFKRVEIHKNVYPKLLKEHLVTQTVDAVFYLRHAWRQAHPRDVEHLNRTLITMQSRIRRTVD